MMLMVEERLAQQLYQKLHPIRLADLVKNMTIQQLTDVVLEMLIHYQLCLHLNWQWQSCGGKQLQQQLLL